MDCQVHIPCDALADIQKTLSAYAPTLHVELHFNSKDMYALRKVSKRTFKLSDFGCNHMHVAETVSFDFFYTCSVELGVASLLLGFEDKLPKIKSRKAIVFRRKRTTSEDGKPNRHGSVDGSWPVARLMPERRGPSTGLCGVMRARSGSASSYNGALHASLYETHQPLVMWVTGIEKSDIVQWVWIAKRPFEQSPSPRCSSHAWLLDVHERC